MDIKPVEYIVRRIKKRPTLTLCYLFITIALTIISTFVVAYVVKKADQFATKKGSKIEYAESIKFDDDVFGIIIGPFYGGSEALNEKGKAFQHSLAATLKAKLTELNATDTLVKKIFHGKFESIISHNEARSIGFAANAKLIIWGDITINGVIPKITIVETEGHLSYFTKCCTDITIFKNSFTHEFLETITDIDMPLVIEEPISIILFSLGIRHFDKGEYQTALHFLKKALRTDPFTTFKSAENYDISQIMTAIGLCHYKLSEFSNAKSSFLRAIKYAPDNVMAGVLLSQCYRRTGETEKMIESYFRASLMLFAKNNPHIIISLENMEKGKYEKVIRELTHIIKKHREKRSPEVFLIRGAAFISVNQYRNAINDFSKVIKEAQEPTMAYWLRAHSFYSIGEFRKAISDLEKFETLEDQLDSEFYRRKGLAYWHEGEKDKALLNLQKAVRANPDDFYANLFLGVNLSQNDQNDDAIVALQTALRIKPNHTFVIYQLALLYEMTGKRGQAIEQYKKVNRVDPDGFLRDDDIKEAKSRLKNLEISSDIHGPVENQHN